ncbi:MAG TPA: DUF5666 domain-containing protein [Acidobacteriaceae bacterium]|nr:DUF5666 domain-containing protein [Acidobacteriaceae bacterium]
MGGVIRNVDPVRDKFNLVPAGGHPIEIRYDARTRFYQNGVRGSVLDLRPTAHASVETTLDGTKIYAVSVHALTHVPGGVTRGQVVSYNPATGKLSINASLASEPITLLVPTDTPQDLVGQEAASTSAHSTVALAAGDLVEVKFKPGSAGQGVATHILILASPGHRFVFGGKLVSLDMHRGTMVILNGADNRNYQVTFYPAKFPASSELRTGHTVRVTAVFNGTKYVAEAITTE